MAVFKYLRRRFYPDLDLEIGITLRPHRVLDYTAHAYLKATGQPGARDRWRKDFCDWAQDRHVDALSPRYGNRRESNSSIFDCYLRTWQTVADFLVYWVGIDALSSALVAADRDRHANGQHDALIEAIESLRREVADAKMVAVAHQSAYRRLGLALLSSSPSLEDTAADA